MTCSPERVTGYVDDVLDAAERLEIEAHLASCAACREQVDAERALRGQLRALRKPEPPAGLEPRLRRALRRERRSWSRVLLPIAAGLALLAFWARGSASFVAWEVALDHAKCFRNDRLPAKVFSEDPERVAAWFEERGTRLPVFPAQAGGLMLVGGRYCPLADGSFAAHIYYASDGDGHAVPDRQSRLPTGAAARSASDRRPASLPACATASAGSIAADTRHPACTTCATPSPSGG